MLPSIWRKRASLVAQSVILVAFKRASRFSSGRSFAGLLDPDGCNTRPPRTLIICFHNDYRDLIRLFTYVEVVYRRR